MFSCKCGNVTLEWINPLKKRLCNICLTEIKFIDKSKQISLNAFEIAKKTMAQNCIIIYNTIKLLKSCNNKKISQHLKWTINRITPRVKDLRDEDLVILDKLKIYKSDSMETMHWKINNKKELNESGKITITSKIGVA